MKKGFFITFEGGEGAGKTTLIESVKEKLFDDKLDLIITREPGGTTFGEHVRELLLKKSTKIKISSKAELCLFLASRSQHIDDVIKPALSAGKIVLCDRYNDSSIAYQGHARGLGIDEVIKFSSFIIEDTLPDLTLYLDIDPKTGLSRVQSKYDRIESEKLSFHQKIREGFHILAKKFPDRIKMIDANKFKDEVLKNAMHYISKIIK
ncbi:MAG: Thymidylate kinase [Candidatus Anoxychlamydiales bacterium]|nr:Thymidylate kinase [Candidatus Anoxychlamydiales bacterium]NGX35290.1 Thymidylate kinase [Candidatus Anoxychlamydiales bacterium]